MIEIVKEKEIEKEEAFQLPKNIRQIGEREKNKRIYIEDYVVTYLKQLRETTKEEQRVLILYGKKEIIDYMPTWFIKGVLETDAEPFYESNLIDEHDWQEINQRAAKFFPGMCVLGWAVIGQESIDEYMDQIELTWRQFFREDQQIFFYASVSEMTEDIYCFEKGQPVRQRGYYIYYEKNENMQNYMLRVCRKKRDLEQQEAEKEVEIGNDHATRQFRSIVQEKKEEIHRKRTMSFLYAASTLLVMVIMVIGITMLNNYEKMENMEDTLRKISGQVEDGFAVKEETKQAMAIDMEEKDDVADVAQENVDQFIEEAKEPTQGSDEAETAVAEQDTENLQEEVNEAPRTEEGSAEEIAETEEQIMEPPVAEEKKQEDIDAANAEPTYTMYEVQKGDTLAKICIRFYGNEERLDEICSLNQITDKDKILYGQKILLP